MSYIGIPNGPPGGGGGSGPSVFLILAGGKSLFLPLCLLRGERGDDTCNFLQFTPHLHFSCHFPQFPTFFSGARDLQLKLTSTFRNFPATFRRPPIPIHLLLVFCKPPPVFVPTYRSARSTPRPSLRPGNVVLPRKKICPRKRYNGVQFDPVGCPWSRLTIDFEDPSAGQ